LNGCVHGFRGDSLTFVFGIVDVCGRRLYLACTGGMEAKCTTTN
jgi:hypothetical protein